MTDTKHLTPGVTEEELIEAEEKRLAKLRAASPESYAESREEMMRMWIRREARENGWPASRLAACLGERMIKIAVDILHEEMHWTRT